MILLRVSVSHHTVLFPADPYVVIRMALMCGAEVHCLDRRTAERTGNCPAGVVVDQDITQPVDTNFYLLSHSAIQGSKSECPYERSPVKRIVPSASRSSHYTILQEEVFKRAFGLTELEATRL